MPWNLGDISAVQDALGSLLTLATMVGSRTGVSRMGVAAAEKEGLAQRWMREKVGGK
jgi:hypothetical protein